MNWFPSLYYYIVVSIKKEEIYYCGNIEFEAFKKFKELPYSMKQIVKADIRMIKISGVDFIDNYKITKKIKG